jgi:diguanylate cyclase (GGDEF)-like protein
MSRRAWAYIWVILGTAAVCMILAAARADFVSIDWVTFLVLITLASLAQLFVAEAPNHVAYFATPIFVFSSLLILQPWQFMALVVIYHTIEWAKERLVEGHRLRDWYIQPTNVAIEIISGLVARGLYAQLMGSFAQTSGLVSVLIGGLAALVFVVVNHTLLGIALVLARGKTWRETGMLTPENVASDVVLLLLGYVIAILWELNPWLVLPALSPLALLYRALQVPGLKAEAETDSKTNLLNPRYFNRRFDSEMERMQRTGRPLALIMADLDYLRVINNTYGHQAGDIVIAGIGRIIAGSIRAYDFAGRFGGEEFAIVLPETEPADACQVAERIRTAVEAAQFAVPTSNEPVRVTMSLGFACLSGVAQTPAELMAEADAAVYQAKAGGRNRVVGPQAPVLQV